ncbi:MULTISPECIES: exopolysaccharide biosynthesis protein [Larsenimonas]|uniref:Exopolysaccharide biosynthesis protein n=1 Tax=Larsenimonas suaedae TaxID=1851019 RepID=A0ABU1GXE5_9GAMM|nr:MULTISPECIES: exopolysaccharide biosynthesis protein [Larsenimonas]MCM2971463.1 exopolysaccharide biosynthesis protein [Larsenimonas suaedae]MCM5703571.1 exopolysaccharide biosynthesis protein [Larsenimonas salina]MDR5896719.1 exopolysaccharide biosynthesis protein [Larsenimonas suaedae]
MAQRIELTGLLETLDDNVEGDETSLGDILEIFEGRGFGPLITIPALIAWLPTGAVPGIPSCCGIFIALMAIQLAMGKKSPWLPTRLKERSISRETLQKTIKKIKPFTRKVDKLLKPRCQWAASTGVLRVLAVFIALLGAAMIPLELLPFAAAVPGFTLTLIGLGIVAQDGVAILGGLAVALGGSVWIATLI